ncbi:E3 ubiquitin-protein ligase UBR1 [Amyelois transitella]|uniref:E3 ubiquitin-protein ligase UBR1 n=1 Tax=Amyelois transitella TaxID=680683 RepID=UPI00298FD042|nr:E3 ubiquitin-protein ligase UBR1 [Amyelois transitella]
MSSPPPVQLEVEVGDESMEEEMLVATDRFTLPARADAVVELWRSKMAEGVLAPSHFQDHWRVTVPRIYSPQPNRTCLDWSFDEELASKLLIQPMEQFVWGSSEGSKPAPRRSTLCGKVFKQGEPAYSCRECGMDNTCVLCVECFKVSAHRHHKYKMGQSGGGGCCDCGDTEAWKREPFCELHAAPSEEEQSSSHISEEVLERMKIVASVVLSYCLRLLTHDHAPGLPNDLRLKDNERDLLQILDQPDCYCTVLYNDETHTFEQVITTLNRVLSCNHRDSVELVTLIDREGRALVKCNSFQVCDKLKTDIETCTAMFERFTSRLGPSLKVLVMHAHVIAHQHYAMKLLTWLQNFVSQEPSLRLTVSQVALGNSVWDASGALCGGGVAGAVMQNDFRMWKAARTAWHRLLIATTLMDYTTKKSMAILFTRNYGSILKDFIRDDHDHSFSISSLSVQLYTTPTLAHHLIANHDALFVVLNTFISECNRRCNNKGRLEFDRNVPTGFKRAQFILYDVKYLLSSVPGSFDDELRKGFLHGLSLMMNLLVMMQGMDSVVRQVGQHMEYEPEWESAFNLHVKLAHSITLCIEWCCAEKPLCAAAYRMALRRHHETTQFPDTVVKELSNKSASVIPYDVSSEPVSIHRPLSRFIAGLHLQLHRHGLSYHSKEFQRPDRARPPPEQGDKSQPDKSKPSPVQLIEPVLQTMAMIAQVHAGMWRRNGFALLNQLYFYHNVKCRSEMLDRDVVMLQMGASLIESNEFIIHVLNKFNLLDWAASDFEQRRVEDDELRYTISMVEEFLGLLITIVGSRWVPGVGEVTAEERTKKEIIQMLCVKPMPHSELNRSLPEDQLHETGLEAVIHEVADFTKPSSGNNRGLYKLKPHLYEEYDTFFYHYTREELSRSEEEQRNRRKAAGLPECCPPPVLPKLSPPFTLLASLLQSDAALHVLKCVLGRALDLRARSFSETQVHKALHLMGYAIRDEESGHYEFLAFAESAERSGLLTMLQQLVNSPRVDAHRHLARWLLQKMRKLLGHTDETEDGVNMETDQEEKPAAEETAEAEKARRAKLAAERRAKLMAQMKTQMNNFISNNATLFEETTTEVTREEQEQRALPRGAALGVWGGGAAQPARVCIMCQEEARVEAAGSPLVLVAFAQQSTVLNRARVGCSGVVPSAWRAAWLPAGVGAQPHVSGCGHALHARCWRKYLDNVLDKENSRLYRLRQPAAFDVEKKEYLCPLCERLCNTALPLLPAPPLLAGSPPPLSEETYAESVALILKLKHQVYSEAVHVCTEFCEEMHCQARAKSVGAMSSDMEEETAEECEVYVSTHSENLLPQEFLVHFQGDIPVYNDMTKSLIENFASKLPGLCGLSETGGMVSIAALYRATAYTILSTNSVLQAESRPLLGEIPARHRDALQVLIRLAAAIPSLWSQPKHLAHHALSSLNTLEATSPLTHEPFGTLIALVLTVPCLFSKPAGPARPTHLARQITLQAFRATITRALIVLDVSDCKSVPMDEGESVDKQPRLDLENLLTIMKELRRGNLDIEDLNPSDVWDKVKGQCRTFLRCCCLFYHFLSDVIPPTELTTVDGDTWDIMCGYLDMPLTFKELIDCPLARKKAREWSDMSNDWFNNEIASHIVVEPSEPPKLIPLPEDFSELMNVVSEFSCPNSEREDSKYPTMCLVCGQILCSQSYCCQTEIRKPGRGNTMGTEHVGAGVAHALQCGAGAGVLLRVRDCELMLLAAPARGAMLPAPYLDRYGETDQVTVCTQAAARAHCELMLLAAPARGAMLPAPYLDRYGETDQVTVCTQAAARAHCELMLLAAPARGAMLPAPYLDRYGETDQVTVCTQAAARAHCELMLLAAPARGAMLPAPYLDRYGETDQVTVCTQAAARAHCELMLLAAPARGAMLPAPYLDRYGETDQVTVCTQAAARAHCELMLLAAPARGAMLPAPYLDRYGETDQVTVCTQAAARAHCELMLLAAPARGAMLPAPYLDRYGETDQVTVCTQAAARAHCELMLLAAPARGAMLPAPYLDRYGETDQGLRRGNPLRLCAARYEKLRALWLSHGTHEHIARALDASMLVAPPWQNM